MAVNWKRFVHENDYAKNVSIDVELSKLNSFYPSIHFTYELEEENKIPFLDVILIKNRNFLELLLIENQLIRTFI